MREEAKNTKKLGNKGFSLIELIIVIAIMAILIGIVGTQVVPYIEKSKQAKDQQVLSGLLTSATTAFASNAELADKAGALSFDVGNNLADANKKISDEFYELAGLKATDTETTKDALMKKFTSKASKDITVITIARDADGVVTVKTTVKDGSKYGSVFETLSST